MMNWQTIVVYLTILAAGVYVGRLVFVRLMNIFNSSKNGCETGCGKCETSPKPITVIRR
jgi:hypothetical protein